MESPVVRIMILAAAVAATAIVIGLMWNILSSNAPQTGTDVVDYGKITTQELCDAVGGSWGTGPCSPPTTSG